MSFVDSVRGFSHFIAHIFEPSDTRFEMEFSSPVEKKTAAAVAPVFTHPPFPTPVTIDLPVAALNPSPIAAAISHPSAPLPPATLKDSVTALKKKAENNDPVACFLLFQYHLAEYEDKPRNYKKAHACLIKAYRLKHPSAKKFLQLIDSKSPVESPKVLDHLHYPAWRINALYLPALIPTQKP